MDTADTKWRPVDSLTEGVFACGLVNSPRNIDESIATAEAAAQRALRIFKQPDPDPDRTEPRWCGPTCVPCANVVWRSARTEPRSLDPDLEKIVVNPAMCQGCGSCAAVCPNSASILTGQTDQQYFEEIDAALQAMLG